MYYFIVYIMCIYISSTFLTSTGQTTLRLVHMHYCWVDSCTCDASSKFIIIITEAFSLVEWVGVGGNALTILKFDFILAPFFAVKII